jgi:hypothetical protein
VSESRPDECAEGMPKTERGTRIEEVTDGGWRIEEVFSSHSATKVTRHSLGCPVGSA